MYTAFPPSLDALGTIKLRVSLMQKEFSSPMGLEQTSLSPPGEEHSKGRCAYRGIYSVSIVCGNEYSLVWCDLFYACCSVRLAQRVLQLERVNSTLRKDVETERTQSQQLQKEASSSIHHSTLYVHTSSTSDRVIEERFVSGSVSQSIPSVCLSPFSTPSQLVDLRSLLSQVGQPQSCLLQSLQQRQEEVRAQRDRATALERELE